MSVNSRLLLYLANSQWSTRPTVSVHSVLAPTNCLFSPRSFLLVLSTRSDFQRRVDTPGWGHKVLALSPSVLAGSLLQHSGGVCHPTFTGAERTGWHLPIQTNSHSCLHRPCGLSWVCRTRVSNSPTTDPDLCFPSWPISNASSWPLQPHQGYRPEPRPHLPSFPSPVSGNCEHTLPPMALSSL